LGNLRTGICNTCKRQFFVVPEIDGTACPVCLTALELEADLAGPGPKGSDRSVLIVDDEPDVRFAVRLMLEEHGYEVIGEATDGMNGLAMLARVSPAFVVLDQMMPSMTGAQAASRFRQAAPETRIVAFSAVVPEHLHWADVFVSKADLATLPDAIAGLAG
jgi:CheY-like chemotaxis protein